VCYVCVAVLGCVWVPRYHVNHSFAIVESMSLVQFTRPYTDPDSKFDNKATLFCQSVSQLVTESDKPQSASGIFETRVHFIVVSSVRTLANLFFFPNSCSVV